MNHYPMHPGDYLRDTAHLSIIEDAVYRRILDWLYINERPLPTDSAKVARLMRVIEHQDAVDAVLNEFLELTADGWVQRRAEREIAEYKARADSARENGRRGGRPKTEAKPKITDPVNSGLPEKTELKTNQNQNQNQNQYIPPTPQGGDEDDQDKIPGILLAYGTIQYGKGKELLESVGIDTDTLTEYTLTQEAETKYATYLRKVGTGYMGDTAESIRNVLADAKAKELTLKQTKDALRKIMDTDEYRIKRLAETELNRSQSMGSIESMVKIQNQTGVTIEKTLMHTGSDVPCEFCKSLIGRWEKVDQVFVREGETIVGADGGILINKFADNECFDPHPNGHCTAEYRVVS